MTIFSSKSGIISKLLIQFEEKIQQSFSFARKRKNARGTIPLAFSLMRGDIRPAV